MSVRRSLEIRRLGRRAACALAASALALAPSACGKKGPPLAPVLRVPAQVAPFEARRSGDTVTVTLAVPAANQDGTSPADIGRVEVYGFTGNPPAPADVFKYGTLVATIPVRRPPPAGSGEAGATSRQPAPPRDQAGVDQGETVTVTEAVTPSLSRKVLTKAQEEAERRRVPPIGPVLAAGPPADSLPTRFYVAVGVTRGGRRGALSVRSTVPLVDPPPTPGAPVVTLTEREITLRWVVPAGARRPIQAPVAKGDKVLESRAMGAGSAGSAYNVYEVPPRGAQPAASAPAGSPALLAPLNEKPLEATSYADARVEWGASRCYVLRVVNRFGSFAIESASSPPACVTMTDTFPPEAPKQLAALAGDGAISLIWEANTEKDLAGYLVLRGEAPGGALAPLTPAPITETTFRDEAAKPGVRYVYAVVAVDTATPPNRSAPSNRVEEALR